jgi:hypothetical protein
MADDILTPASIAEERGKSLVRDVMVVAESNAADFAVRMQNSMKRLW